MKETMAKLKALVSMKSALVKALAGDLEDAVQKITQRDLRIAALKSELNVFKQANRALIDRQVEDHNMIKCLEDDVFLLSQRSEYRSEKMAQLAQEIELLKTEKRQLKEENDQLKEWWREMDEDEDYIAGLEVMASDDIPFEIRQPHEEEA